MYYRVLTALTVPIHYFTLLFAAYVVGTQDLPWHAVLGLALSVGVVNGLAINTGHELGHKNTKLERWLAKIVLALIGYGHFFIEHNRGHHLRRGHAGRPGHRRWASRSTASPVRDPRRLAARLGSRRRAWAATGRRPGRSTTRCCSRC